MTKPQKPQILVVDDDAKVRLLLRRCFEGDGYRVAEAGSCAEAIRRIDSEQIDLVTLDLTLPDGDGLSVSREIRARSKVPIIMVTGKGDPIDRIVGLEIGADDYISKPFHLREVLARVHAVLRRSESGPVSQQGAGKDGEKNILCFEGWHLDLIRRELKSQSGDVCDLTTSEFELLKTFVTHVARPLSRDQIMDLLRGHDWAPTDRSIDNLVVKLRRKIEADPANPRFIKTVRGIGYCFTADLKRGS